MGHTDTDDHSDDDGSQGSYTIVSTPNENDFSAEAEDRRRERARLDEQERKAQHERHQSPSRRDVSPPAKRLKLEQLDAQKSLVPSDIAAWAAASTVQTRRRYEDHLNGHINDTLILDGVDGIDYDECFQHELCALPLPVLEDSTVASETPSSDSASAVIVGRGVLTSSHGIAEDRGRLAHAHERQLQRIATWKNMPLYVWVLIAAGHANYAAWH